MAVELTSALEDYLETIFRLTRSQPYARVRDIARDRGVKPGSVSPALKRLAEQGLVKYERREYVTLTSEGQREARRVHARHRVLTRFFSKILRMPEETAELEACAMKHSLSNEGMDRLVRFFEFVGACPTSSGFLERFHACSLVHPQQPPCPHVCSVEEARAASPDSGEVPAMLSLYDLEPGEEGQVKQVNAVGAIRQRLLDMGVLPQTRVSVERVAPTGDPVWIRLDGSQLALRRQEAQAVVVART